MRVKRPVPKPIILTVASLIFFAIEFVAREPLVRNPCSLVFDRRGRLVLENKRLNQVHKAILSDLKEGLSVDTIMALSANDVANLPSGNDMPKALSRLVGQVIDAGGAGNSSRFLMHEGIASKLVDRLVNGGILTAEQRTAFMDAFVDAPDPFFDKAESKK